MPNLTSHEKKVLVAVLLLIFVGLAVKTIRTARLDEPVRPNAVSTSP